LGLPFKWSFKMEVKLLSEASIKIHRRVMEGILVLEEHGKVTHITTGNRVCIELRNRQNELITIDLEIE